MGVETEIQIKIKTASPFEARAKMEHLKQMATIETEVLEKLAKLFKKPNAAEQFKNNYPMIEEFLG